jgi:hypothetical protein
MGFCTACGGELIGAGIRPGSRVTFLTGKVTKATAHGAWSKVHPRTLDFPKIGLKIGAGTKLSPPWLRTMFLVSPIFSPIFGCAQIAV